MKTAIERHYPDNVFRPLTVHLQLENKSDFQKVADEIEQLKGEEAYPITIEFQINKLATLKAFVEDLGGTGGDALYPAFEKLYDIAKETEVN